MAPTAPQAATPRAARERETERPGRTSTKDTQLDRPVVFSTKTVDSPAGRTFFLLCADSVDIAAMQFRASRIDIAEEWRDEKNSILRARCEWRRRPKAPSYDKLFYRKSIAFL
mmetsp:Transcript_19830/g.63807  ORF Transcript_19830/g.63807 Transcript_19830/m.63807 type:complete len:113 (+) Transcript_19830:430-768(+)